MSIVKYGPPTATVTLPYAQTLNFAQDVVYDDMGGTDWHLIKFDCTFQSVLNLAYLDLIAPDLKGVAMNAADIMRTIRARLMKPRQPFSVTFNGVELIPQIQDGNVGNVDAQNGPKPQGCQITRLNNTTFLVTWRVVANYWENPNPGTGLPTKNLQGNVVLFNRWSETVDMDMAQYSKITREGKFVIRSDNKDGLVADQVRTQMAIFAPRPGFLREGVSYTVSPDGLAIQYKIVEKEVYKMPPNPAFEADGEYMETSTKFGGFNYASVRVRLRGDRQTDQAKLARTAISVATQKIRLGGVLQDAKTRASLISDMSLYVALYENVVEVRAQARMNPGVFRVYDVTWLSHGPLGSRSPVCFTPGSDDDRGYQPNYFNYGTAGILLKAAAYYDPSVVGVNVSFDENRQLSAGKLVGTVGKQGE